MLILDDRAMRALKAAQADDLHELVSERAVAPKPRILTSHRAPKDWYPLFPNKVVGESPLNRLINNSYQVFMDGPGYRLNRRPGRPVAADTGKASK